jgi:uncharacterized protein (DUF1810 family)
MNESKFADFVEAQDRVYDCVLDELVRGRKVTHWMWFIFPQLAGLGSSVMAQKFAVATLDEARAYLAHPTLGSRLLECTRLLLSLKDNSPSRVLGQPDDRKLHSCMTLFAIAAADQTMFRAALEKFFDGMPDSLTLKLLNDASSP